MGESEGQTLKALAGQCVREGIGDVDIRAANPLGRQLIHDGQVDFVRMLSLGNVALDAVHQTEDVADKRLRDLGYTDIRYIDDRETDSIIVVAGNGKEVVVSIRGYDSPKDNDTSVTLGYEPSALSGEVSEGFLRTLYRSSPPLISQVHQAIEEVSQEYGGNLPVHFASHSMGGALATTIIAEMGANPERFPQFSHIRTNLTFDSLKPGDMEFKEAYEELCRKNGIESVGVIHQNSLAPLLPPLNSEVGRTVILQSDGSTTVDANAMDDLLRIWGSGHTESHYQAHILDRLRLEALRQIGEEQPELIKSGEVSVGDNVCLPTIPRSQESPLREFP